MKVLLLEHPRSVSQERCNDIANTPLSSCLLSGYTTAVLQSDGHQAEIVEGYLDKLSYPEVEKQIMDYHPDLLGVHMVYHWQGDGELFTLLRTLKDDGVVPYIFAYGYYPTFFYENIMDACPEIDGVIVGEPEETAADLAHTLARRQDREVIPGLVRRNAAGEVQLTHRPLIKDLDSLPFPVRTEAMFKIPEVNIQGSRGCYGGCTFCYINPFYGPEARWRGRSPEDLVAEIDEIIEKYGVRQFYFTDPNFFGPGQRGQIRAMQLASLLKSRHITFGIEGRVNDISEKSLAALVDAGLIDILIGLESGRDESLRRMNKMTTVAQNEEALALLRKHGIEPSIGFIMFEPDSTLDDVRINFQFLQRNKLLEKLDVTANLLYHHQIILMGTPAFRQLEKQGRLHKLETTYEGMTHYENKDVAALAEMMRRLTNIVFDRMNGVWSGRVATPEDGPVSYRLVNNLLVGWFDQILSDLQKGISPDAAHRDAFVAQAEQQIDPLLA